MRILIYSFIIVLADQITKFFVKGISIPWLGIKHAGLNYGTSINVLGNFFRITFIENPGMAFGIEFGGQLTRSIFTIIATIIIIIFIYKNRNGSFYLRLSLALILGGAVGNLIDRLFFGIIYGYAPLFYGKVVDFLHFDIPDFNLFGKHFYTWPIFNIADMSVTAGFLLILLGYNKLFKKKEEINTTDQKDLDYSSNESIISNYSSSESNLEPPKSSN